MPRTKKKLTPPAPAPQPVPQAAEVNGPPDTVFTLSEAAAYLRFSEADVLRLVHDQGLPARRLANEWRFFKSAIQDWLRTGPPPQGSKEVWLSLAGVWKDDPYVEDELKEILKRRGRRMAEDEE
jgi:excisionase family DNA binding protein